jgi:hypothetical protein
MARIQLSNVEAALNWRGILGGEFSRKFRSEETLGLGFLN